MLQVPTWEYYNESLQLGNTLSAKMNQLGQMGWEAYAIHIDPYPTHVNVFFKRRIDLTD